MAWVEAHSFGDDAKRAFHDPPVVASRVGQFECSLVDALEVACSQLIAAVKEETELVVAVGHLTNRGARGTGVSFGKRSRSSQLRSVEIITE